MGEGKEDPWKVPFGELAEFSVDRSASGFYWVTPEGRIVYTNKTLQDRLGYSEDELREMHVWDIDPKYSQENREEFWERLKEEKNRTFESKHETKSGEVYPVEVTSHYIEYGEGEYFEFAFVKGITEQKEMREKYRIITEASSNGIYVFQDGEFKFVNEALVELSGYSREELKNMNFLDLVHPDYREDIVRWTDQALEGDTSGLPDKHEIEVLRKNGDSVWVKITPSFVEYEEKPAIVGNVANITERKKMEENLTKSEERYRRLFETAQDGMLILNAESGEIKDANPYIQDLTGFSKEELVGKELWEIGSFEDVVENKKRFDELVDESFIRYEDLPIETKKGEDKMVEFVSNTYQAGGDKVVQCNIRDVSERKKAEEREEFLHTLLRHDVRNKSQIVQGYLELAEDYDLPEDLENYLSKARKATRDGIDIIEKVRTLRDVEEEDETREISIGSILKNVISENKPQASEKGISITCQDDMCKIMGGSLLEEMFSNLIENSINHSKCDEIRISAREKEDKCIITVEDDGIGISDEDKDKIFKKGFKSEDTGGSGLGLYLVKKIAENYGGSVKVEDSELDGAKFNVHLQKA